MNKLLIIDLSKESFEVEEIPENIMKEYLGGRGLGAYLLYKYLPAKVDPLSPENILIFSTGPAQGTSTYYSSRTVLNTKSPLTGVYLFSLASGNFGHKMKKAGYTAMMVKGKAQSPVYLAIEDGKVQFRSAQKIWGQKTIEAQESMLADAGLPAGKCVCIGPSGEKLHKMAAIITEGEKARSFGRGGCGAVMGSKNLKGIVMEGSQQVELADPASLKEAKQVIGENVKGNPAWLDSRIRYGSGADMSTMNELGIIPTRNWYTGTFEKLKSIDLVENEKTWPRKNVTCGPYCINPCSHTIEIQRGPYKGAKTEGPEYETIYSFGSNCGVDQFDAVVAAEELCDHYGIDTMSCGCTIAFAMECFEKGLLTKKDTGGIDLHFGNAEAMVKMTEMIAKQEGLGALLSQGTRAASEKIPGSADFAIHVKGLEPGGYECRGSWGQALQYGLNSRGACHHGYGLPARLPAEMENPMKIEGKGTLVKNSGMMRVLFDCICMCSFPTGMVGGLPGLVKVVNALTGGDFSEEKMKEIGFRILTLERMFNVREGISRKDDYLPARLLKEPLPDGPHKGATVPMDELLNEGYEAFGWDVETGIPKTETLEALGINKLG